MTPKGKCSREEKQDQDRNKLGKMSYRRDDKEKDLWEDRWRGNGC